MAYALKKKKKEIIVLHYRDIQMCTRRLCIHSAYGQGKWLGDFQHILLATRKTQTLMAEQNSCHQLWESYNANHQKHHLSRRLGG